MKKTSEQLAWLIRRHGIEMTHLSGGSHIGAVLSAADILAVLYADILRYDPEDPEWDGRDRFIMSKGHAGAAVYAASKAFVRNYTRALARELKKSGITATAVCPYWTKTDFFARVHQHTGNKLITKYEVMYDAEKVVDKAIKDAEKGKDMSVYGALNKLQHVAIKLLPQALIMTLWQRRQHLDI